MSIYATTTGIEHHEPVGAPWIYQGSHVLPSEEDPRGGEIGLAYIPSHITRDGRDDQPEDGTPWPWLRVSVDTGGDPAVLLNPAQARYLAEQLLGWADDAAGIRDAARQAAGQPDAVEETHIVADDSDDPEHVDDCPGCETAVDHDEHCPTPETHNWGCGCPTDKWPAADARSSIAAHMGTQGNDPTLALLLNRYHEAVARQAVAEHTAAAGQPDTQQTEAHPPTHRWQAEFHDPVADEWIAHFTTADRDKAVERLQQVRSSRPRWADDGTPVDRRLVRETTTWTVEEVPPAGLSPEDQAMETRAAADEAGQ